jgi:hypothetical protein
VDWVNIGNHIPYRLEPVEKLQYLSHLIVEVYLAALVVPAPPLDCAAPLQLCRVAMHFGERIVESSGGCWQRSTYRISFIAGEFLEGVCQNATRKSLVRKVW